MLLRKLRCYHFKNYTSIELNFATQLNCIVGANGAGKTNLLDAIHYLSLTKSAFNSVDAQNILHGEAQMSMQGHFFKDDKLYEVKCIIDRDQGKTLQVNSKVYKKMREHIGQFPIVLTTPYDTELIRSTSEIRRKFFDTILCQIDPNYLHTLIQYQQVLKHRNGFLKMNAGNFNIDLALVNSYNKQLLPLCKQLYAARKTFLDIFYPLLQQQYEYFVDAPEVIEMSYESDVCNPDFEQRFFDNIKEDLLAQRTILGIHRDEYTFTLNNYPLKKFGSQGQQKSFIIALRLAQFACIEQALGCKPLLLLDDIFDKLDEQRIEKLVSLMAQQYFGQVWITDAGGKRSAAILKEIQADKALFKIEAGRLVENLSL
jgi:DNA replication and repair protein RecF